jgi:DeoR family transcriptional regulator, fructose operon transcriptional repressor
MTTSAINTSANNTSAITMSANTADQVAGSKLQAERQRQIYRVALRNGSVDVSELARQFDVTPETIRRDLSELQDHGVIRRVHGGAVLVERNHYEPTVGARDVQNAAEKAAIAKMALDEIPASGSVMIDSGSTGLKLAECFRVEPNVHVVTNSLITALTLVQRGVSELTVLGGGVRANTLAMVDAATVEAIRLIRVDVLFISCDGLSFQRGLTTPLRAEWEVKRAMIASARRVVALVDQSKLGTDLMYSYADLDDLDVLITDSRVDTETVSLIAGKGVEVRRA